jgi:hypothetical protein
MKKIKIISAAMLSCLLMSSAQAYGSHDFDEVSVRIKPESFGENGFWCNGRQFGSDMPLPKFHGCEAKETTFGPHSSPALLMRAHYSWSENAVGVSKPMTQTFIELPGGELFRFKDTRFITSAKLNDYFRDRLNLGHAMNPENTVLHLSRAGKRSFQAFGQTFCLSYRLKMPFKGAMGWCQGDVIVAGDISYQAGVLPYAEAVVAAQTYLYDTQLPITNSRLIQPETLVNFSEDENGYYWAFAVPSSKANIKAYRIQVYMDASIRYNRLRVLPKVPDAL